MGALLGFVVAVAPSCGTPEGKPACKPSNCAGCCDKNGECQAGTQTFACGVRAEGCQECGPTQSCVDAKCAGGSGGAGGGTGGSGGAGGGSSACPGCLGCCDSGGVCRGGNTNQTCGGSGAACVACPAGQSCQSAACAAVICTMGCKDTAGVCLAGNADGACGTGGASCVACGAGQACSNGSCSAPCNATTCASGCCDGTNCIVTPTAMKCGINGGACAICSGTQSCQGGICQAGGAGGGAGGGAAGGGAGGGVAGPCGPTTCSSGCCSDDGFGTITCVGGSSTFACGKNGAACKFCSVAPFLCISKACL